VVLANTGGSADMAKIVESIREAVASTKLPEGFYTRLEGTFQAQEEASRTIGILSLLSLSLIFAIFFKRYRSGLLARIVLGNVPLALIGAVIALWLTGQPLSVASMVGFITLTGIAARNGILMISHFQHLERYEGEPFGPGLVLRGAKERLAPILMTALATALALVPLAVPGAIPGHEIEHPMAIVILGGLVTATMLNLFVLPSLYLRFGKSRRVAAS
jgi:Cu/Ag efflux pump CusA